MSKGDIEKWVKKMKPINLDIIPDECYDDVKTIIAEMKDKFKRIETHIIKEYEEIISKNTSTMDIIDSIKHSQYSKILFAIHANKPYDKLIWKLL